MVYELKWLRTIPVGMYFVPLSRAYLATLIRLPFILYDRKYRFLPLDTPPTE